MLAELIYQCERTASLPFLHSTFPGFCYEWMKHGDSHGRHGSMALENEEAVPDIPVTAIRAESGTAQRLRAPTAWVCTLASKGGSGKAIVKVVQASMEYMAKAEPR